MTAVPVEDLRASSGVYVSYETNAEDMMGAAALFGADYPAEWYAPIWPQQRGGMYEMSQFGELHSAANHYVDCGRQTTDDWSLLGDAERVDAAHSCTSDETAYQLSRTSSPIFKAPAPEQLPRTHSPFDDTDGDEAYAHMLFRCLRSAPGHKMSLRAIYDWIYCNSPRVRGSSGKGWQNSVRHNLSMNEGFMKEVPPGPTKSKKATMWMLTEESMARGYVRSTTTFRKHSARYTPRAKRQPPAVKRVESGSKGGLASRRAAQRRATKAASVHGAARASAAAAVAVAVATPAVATPAVPSSDLPADVRVNPHSAADDTTYAGQEDLGLGLGLPTLAADGLEYVCTVPAGPHDPLAVGAAPLEVFPGWHQLGGWPGLPVDFSASMLPPDMWGCYLDADGTSWAGGR